MNRRDLLKAAPLVLVPAPLAAMPREDAIHHHANELLRLLRERLPEGSSVTATITDTGAINGRALARLWRPDAQRAAGGSWVEERAGEVWL